MASENTSQNQGKKTAQQKKKSDIEPNVLKKEIPQKETIRRSIWILLGRVLFVKIVFIIFILLARNFLFVPFEGEANIFFFLTRGGLYALIQLVDLAVLSWIVLEWFTEKYIFTPKQVTLETGILSTHRKVYVFENIEAVKMDRGLLGLIFGFGSLRILAPIIQEKVTIRDIPEPRKYLHLVEQGIEQGEKNIIFP